jgi:hypothetical protein
MERGQRRLNADDHGFLALCKSAIKIRVFRVQSFRLSAWD